MNFPLNLAKSSLLALAVFWTIILSEDGFDADFTLLILLSCIPIFLVVTVVIIFTICPIYWLAKKEDFNKQQVFKTYFPYYTTIAFFICVFGMYSSNFDTYMIAFFSSAYITTSQSWVWFAKENTKQNETT